MRTDTTHKIPNAFIAYISIISLMLYIFCYQFEYTFSSTVFLYIAFGGFLFWMFVSRKTNISIQALIMVIVVFTSLIGSYYSKIPEKGNREAIVTGVSWIFLIVFAQDVNLLNRLKKIICYISFLVLLGVFVQYMIPDTLNNYLQTILRIDCYEQLIWSYNVDGAYAGFMAYVPDAAYFCATLFGFVIFGWLEGKDLTFKNKLFRLIIILFSVYGIILTSKRGIAVALVIAFLLTYIFWKKFSGKAIAGAFSLIIIGVIVISILSEQNETVNLFLQRFDNTGGGDLTTGRSEIWQRAIDGLTNWVIGMGTGSSYMIHGTGLHNIYLQLIFDHGIIGFIFYLVFFIYNLVCAIKKQEPLSIYIQLLILVYGMSGNPIYSNSFFIVYIIFSVVPCEAKGQRISL